MASETIVETSPLLGRLSWAAIPTEPIVLVTFAVVVLGGLGVLALLTKYKMWGYLWKEWFTTVDHKKIGIMYMILGLIMFLRGFLLRGYADDHGPDELSGPAPNWRARRVVPLPEQLLVLDDDRRCHHGHGIAVCG